jgi:hypothetical protein
MKRLIFLFSFFFATLASYAQNFELLDTQENYLSTFNQQVRIPVKIKNSSDKSQFYIVKRTKIEQLETQKSYFCIDNKCLEPDNSEFSKRIEPGETINLVYVVETGMLPGQSVFKFEVFPKGSPAEIKEHSVSINVEEKSSRNYIYQSKEISVQEIYPNPLQEIGLIDYKIIDAFIKAKIVFHTILGKAISDYELDPTETRVKIFSEEMNSGVYFYTLYINGSGVATRKIIVRK